MVRSKSSWAGDEEGFHRSTVRNEILLQRGAFPRGGGEGRTASADGSKAGAAFAAPRGIPVLMQREGFSILCLKEKRNGGLLL